MSENCSTEPLLRSTSPPASSRRDFGDETNGPRRAGERLRHAGPSRTKPPVRLWSSANRRRNVDRLGGCAAASGGNGRRDDWPAGQQIGHDPGDGLVVFCGGHSAGRPGSQHVAPASAVGWARCDCGQDTSMTSSVRSSAGGRPSVKSSRLRRIRSRVCVAVPVQSCRIASRRSVPNI